jgi:hypothetical protein
VDGIYKPHVIGLKVLDEIAIKTSTKRIIWLIRRATLIDMGVNQSNLTSNKSIPRKLQQNIMPPYGIQKIMDVT